MLDELDVFIAFIKSVVGPLLNMKDTFGEENSPVCYQNSIKIPSMNNKKLYIELLNDSNHTSPSKQVKAF